MAHQQITEGTIERYIRREMGAEDRREFEEHLLDCSECFEEVQLLERFVAGVRHIGRIESRPQAVAHREWRWLAPALAAVLTAVLVVAGVWIGTLRRSLSAEIRARQAAMQAAEVRPVPDTSAELIAGNLPVAVLNATRAAGREAVLSVPVGAREVALWMDVELGGGDRRFALAISADTGREVATIAGLTRNTEGAVAVMLPAAKLPAGRYTIRLSSEAPSRLLAQYNLKITAQQ
jgi:anti-sigma factor RsiW